MALGAGKDDVVKLVTRQGMKLAVIGIAFGAPMAFGLVMVIRSMLFSSEFIEPELIAGVTLALAAVAFAATYLPAVRASRIHPVRALSTE